MSARGWMILAGIVTIALAASSAIFPWWTRTDHTHFALLTVEADLVTTDEYRLDGFRRMETNTTNLGNIETTTDVTFRYGPTQEPNKGGVFLLALVGALIEIALGLLVIASAAVQPKPGRGSGRTLLAVLLLFFALAVPAYVTVALPGAAIADQVVAGDDIVVDSFAGLRSVTIGPVVEQTTTWGPSLGWYLSAGAALAALVVVIAAVLLGRTPSPYVYGQTPVIHFQRPQPPGPTTPPLPPPGEQR